MLSQSTAVQSSCFDSDNIMYTEFEELKYLSEVDLALINSSLEWWGFSMPGTRSGILTTQPLTGGFGLLGAF